MAWSLRARSVLTLGAALVAVALSAPPVGAHDREPDAAAELRALAEAVEDAARALHRGAERAADRPRRRERRALRELARLERAAEHFRDEVERYLDDPWADPDGPERAFLGLQRRYRRAEARFDDLPGGGLHPQVDRLAWAVHDVEAAYPNGFAVAHADRERDRPFVFRFPFPPPPPPFAPGWFEHFWTRHR